MLVWTMNSANMKSMNNMDNFGIFNDSFAMNSIFNEEY